MKSSRGELLTFSCRMEIHLSLQRLEKISRIPLKEKKKKKKKGHTHIVKRVVKT